jgi:hypothetical protein
MSNPNPTNKNPPIEGQWKPGQSGNPAGGRKHKAFRLALERNLAILGGGDPNVTMDKIAVAHLTRCTEGDMGAIKELADRLDGKVPQSIGGTDELPGIKGFAWIDTKTE